MPRKTKEPKELEKEKKSVKKVAENEKKSTSKTKTVKPKEITTTSIETVATKKSGTKNTSTTSKKSSTTKKVTPKAATKKKASTTKKRAANKIIDIVEYYDLPYRYNQTVVKVLAQTPANLFIYWDISDKDRKNFESQYGQDFFDSTKPVLIVYNDTLGYKFEVEINDFANSWYLHVNDSKCQYRIELGRRPIKKTEKINTDYIYVSTSNGIESPNDHILFDKNQKMVYFRNVKTGIQTKKQITSISFIRNMGKIYNIYDFYKSIYQDENIEELYNTSNPSSGNPSSRKFVIKIQIKIRRFILCKRKKDM